MSKRIFLELTEKEAEVLQAAIIKERNSWEDMTSEQVSGVTRENKMIACNSIWAKVDEAYHPKPDILITEKDLFFIKSTAIDEYKRLPNDTRLSGKEIDQKDLVHISLANSLLGWLNGKGFLKRLVKFDFTDHSTDYEGNEY